MLIRYLILCLVITQCAFGAEHKESKRAEDKAAIVAAALSTCIPGASWYQMHSAQGCVSQQGIVPVKIDKCSHHNHVNSHICQHPDECVVHFFTADDKLLQTITPKAVAGPQLAKQLLDPTCRPKIFKATIGCPKSISTLNEKVLQGIVIKLDATLSDSKGHYLGSLFLPPIEIAWIQGVQIDKYRTAIKDLLNGTRLDGDDIKEIVETANVSEYLRKQR